MRWYEYKMEVDDLHASDDLKAKLLALQANAAETPGAKSIPMPAPSPTPKKQKKPLRFPARRWAQLAACVAVCGVCLYGAVHAYEWKGVTLLGGGSSSNYSAAKASAPQAAVYSMEDTENAASGSADNGISTFGAEDSYRSADTAAGGSLLTSGEAESDASTRTADSAKIIYTANLTLETRDYDTARAALDAALSDADGYMESSSEYTNTDSTRSVSLTLRVPQDSYKSFLAAAAQSGSVTYQNQQAEDITTRYMDTEARLASLTAQRTRLQELQAQADTLADLLEIESSLSDVQYREVSGISEELSLRRAWDYMNENDIQTLAVVDEDRHLKGLLTLGDIARFYIEDQDANALAEAKTSYRNLVDVLDGTLEVGDIDQRFEQGSVVVAAANPDVLEDYIGKNDMVILGNRYESQLCAIEMSAGCMVIGLGSKVSRTIRKLASENGVSIIATPYDTYTCVKVIGQAVPVRHVMRKKRLITFEPEETVEDVKRTVSKKRIRYYPLMDEQGRYVGMFSQRNLLDLERPSVILVDHNERDQAAEGIRSTNIVEIIDHHRIDSVETSGPIYFRNQPLGCTATIITQMYHEHNVEIEPKIAGLLCSAILSDTLMFRSPTCTPLDRMAAEELAKIAGLDIKQYATEMFRSSSRLLDRSMDELFHMDFKYFQVQNQKIAISQVTSVSENELSGIRDKMLEYMESCLASSGLSMLFAMLTNIIEEKTELLYVGKGAQQLVRAAFKTDCGEHSVVLPGVVSRKKQMVAPLVGAMEHDEEIE